jgi:hypothetical protein
MAGAGDFDHQRFFATVDARRQASGLSWPGLARALWEQSALLNARRPVDHPISAATIRKLGESGRGLSCQHALFVLRWLDMPPEAFILDPAQGTAGVPLPEASPAHRLRWNLRKLHTTLDTARKVRNATWQQTAAYVGCTTNQLTGLRTARFATGLTVAMRITQALHRPAADFVYPADW